MLKSCVGYHNIGSYYVNNKIGEIIITLDNWEKGFYFLKFMKVFYNTTIVCFFV